MPRRLLALALLLTVEMGCPHSWGRGGTIDMALEKDLTEYYSHRACGLSTEEWTKRCQGYWRMPSSKQEACPAECRPPPEESR